MEDLINILKKLKKSPNRQYSRKTIELKLNVVKQQLDRIKLDNKTNLLTAKDIENQILKTIKTLNGLF